MAVATGLLKALGAGVAAGDAPGAPPAVLVGAAADVPSPGVPPGTLDYAVGLALAAGALAAVLAGHTVEVRARDVALQLHLPQVMAAAYASPTWPEPPAPVPAPDHRSWLACELGAPGDRERYDALLATLEPGVDAAAVARAAQEWRLPVCDYRPRPPVDAGSGPVAVVRTASPESPGAEPPGATRGVSGAPAGVPVTAARPAARSGTAAGPPLAGVTVVDLTAMWAGPLCTWLLGRLGATVLKVEPDVRPDGMRAFDGRGVHPGGRSAAPGSDSALFQALNSGKERRNWDLRHEADRRALVEAVALSDVVVDSFSPRVMPNLGLTRDLLTVGDHARITLSMPAFPPGPMRSWVAYGTGVHAVSGLGAVGSGADGSSPTSPTYASAAAYASPAVTYPDPLTGLAGAVAVLAGLVGRRQAWVPTHMEVDMLSVVSPLLRCAAASLSIAERDPDLGARLLAAAGADATVPLPVAGRDLPHPVGPFRGAGLTLPASPAPPWPAEGAGRP